MRGFLRTLNLTGWLTVALIALLLLTAGSCVWMAGQDATERQKITEAHKTLAEGRTAAAGDASAIRDRADARDKSTDDLTRSNTDAIRTAPGADMRLDPDLDAAARRAICLRQSARNDPQCRALFGPDS